LVCAPEDVLPTGPRDLPRSFRPRPDSCARLHCTC
jgi:hypothetical protein